MITLFLLAEDNVRALHSLLHSFAYSRQTHYAVLICTPAKAGQIRHGTLSRRLHPRFASGNLGMRPATLLSSLMLAISGLGLHHPRVGSRPIWTLVKKIKMTSKWMSFYFMAEDMGLEPTGLLHLT